jgi:hypothetical protein
MVIRNSDVDYENVQKYGIQLVQGTKTLHVNTPSIHNIDNKNKDFENNYVRFHTYISDPAHGSMLNKTQRELDDIDASARSKSFTVTDTVSCTPGHTLDAIAGYDNDIYYQMKKDYFGDKADTRPDGM